MRSTTTICPVCKAERREVSEEDNMHEYVDENVSETCGDPECMDNPENRLLEAIFGGSKTWANAVQEMGRRTDEEYAASDARLTHITRGKGA